MGGGGRAGGREEWRKRRRKEEKKQCPYVKIHPNKVQRQPHPHPQPLKGAGGVSTLLSSLFFSTFAKTKFKCTYSRIRLFLLPLFFLLSFSLPFPMVMSRCRVLKQGTVIPLSHSLLLSFHNLSLSRPSTLFDPRITNFFFFGCSFFSKRTWTLFASPLGNILLGEVGGCYILFWSVSPTC